MGPRRSMDGPSPFFGGRSGLTAEQGGRPLMSEEKTAMGDNNSSHVPVTYERCEHIAGPFYHGTKSALEAGDELVPGYGSNFQEGRVSNHIYFTALVDTAA